VSVAQEAGEAAFVPLDDIAGPRRASSLLARRRPLAAPAAQLALLDSLELRGGDFERRLAEAGLAGGLRPLPVEIFQINLGKLCNMTCAHCHVDAGPDRAAEMMTRETAEACVRALDATTASVVDLTGGAPELSPVFRYLVEEAVARGKHVIDRCNLSVLLLPRSAGLAEWMAERGVEVCCSLPHWRRPNVDAQRGDGAFEKSIAGLKLLNGAGYGQGDPRRVLTLVANPAGAWLPASQASMEDEWRRGLLREHGVTFDRLSALANMPISRFLEWLQDSGNLQPYVESLVAGFNPATLERLMCRNTLSVSWDGRLFDCDFNQMLDMGSASPSGAVATVFDFRPDELQRRRIRTARHCFGCTAGAGSSCGGALEPAAPR
jgi:radical SAM/Cys-rich protein